MANWYYVQGSERIGPVDENILKNLFSNEELTLDSYVWRKGFQNWERIKDVSELNLSPHPEVTSFGPERRNEKLTNLIEETKDTGTNSPEIIFNFDWAKIKNEEELFFIKIGQDRKAGLTQELFGPYSLNELHDALNEKRINNQSLIFAPGMPGWVELGETPLDPKNLKLNTSNLINEAPLLIVLENSPIPLITMVKEAGTKKCILLGSGPFQTGKMVMCSIYSGTSLKAINLKLNIEEYRPHEQKILCEVIEINENAKKIMQNYAE